jgi:D-hexose-6-phosphate mutarotase
MSVFDDSVTLSAGDDSVQVSAFGAHVLSWKVDGEERVWLSSLSPSDMSAPVRADLWHTAASSLFHGVAPHARS